ncbi:MAG: hypothetical protein JWL85_630 [Candidatus Saccharibacteria bacterium]|nr:hypothetical protein [Candidatus Saccharibacteria bacterium]
MSEIARTSLLIEPQTALDEELFERLQSIPSPNQAIYEQLTPSAKKRAQEKEWFYSQGMRVNPDLRPDTVDLDELDAHEQGLLDFKDYLLGQNDIDPDIKQLYRWKVNELIGSDRMLRAAVPTARGAVDKKRFNAYNEFLYGRPDEEIFRSTASWFRGIAEQALAHESPDVQETAREIMVMLQDIPEGDKQLIPDEEVFKAIREQHFKEGGYYSLLLAGVELPEKSSIKPDAGEPAIAQMLKNVGAADYTRVMTKGAGWSVANGRKELMGPSTYNMPLRRFIGLPLGHEGGSHILEYINGSRSKVRLLSTGLDRYENGNEGRAVIREQVPYDTMDAFSKILRWQDIMRRHLAISLASGLAGENMNFAKTYAVINTIDRLWERNKSPDDIKAADQKAHNRTYNLLERIFRGTDGGDGGVYLKDMVYLEGNIRAWETAETEPELIEQGDLGKFNINRERNGERRHVKVLRRLGVLTVANA